MAKTTRKTESTPAASKPVVRRARAAAPAAGAEKTTIRRTKKASGAAPGTSPAPTHDEIALRAWSYYESRGGEHGQAMDDWLRAKAELCRERGLEP